MRALDLVMSRQLSWAAQRGLSPDGKSYLQSVGENLFAPLSSETEAEFRTSAGNELTDRPGEAAKMRAVHSSSGLVCNLFDYWRTTDREAIARALDIPSPIEDVRFEAQLATGLRGTPPTLDLLVVASATQAWGVESKFTEPFQTYAKRVPFAESYFEDELGLWSRLGLPRCQRLAEDISRGQTRFSYLDAPQLLKHALGLRRAYAEGQLLYLFYDVNASEVRLLAEEIQTFARSVDEALGFRAVKHQEVFARLSAEAAASASYLDYLRTRYFAV
jgi:hypothetical protein